MCNLINTHTHTHHFTTQKDHTTSCYYSQEELPNRSTNPTHRRSSPQVTARDHHPHHAPNCDPLGRLDGGQHLCRLFCRVLWFQDGRSNSRAPPNDGTFQDSVEKPARCAGERIQPVAGHAIPRSRAHMHTYKHAHTYIQIDSRSFAPKKLLIINRASFVRIWWNSSRVCLMILHKRPKKLLPTRY